jgi:hypothetical protein
MLTVTAICFAIATQATTSTVPDSNALDQLDDRPVHMRVRLIYRAALLMRDHKGISLKNQEDVADCLYRAGLRVDVYSEAQPDLVARDALRITLQTRGATVRQLRADANWGNKFDDPKHHLLSYVDLACLMFIHVQGVRVGPVSPNPFDLMATATVLSRVTKTATTRTSFFKLIAPANSSQRLSIPLFTLDSLSIPDRFGNYFSDAFCQKYERELPSAIPGMKSSDW